MKSARLYSESFRFLWSRRSAGEFEGLQSSQMMPILVDQERPTVRIDEVKIQHYGLQRP